MGIISQKRFFCLNTIDKFFDLNEYYLALDFEAATVSKKLFVTQNCLNNRISKQVTLETA